MNVLAERLNFTVLVVCILTAAIFVFSGCARKQQTTAGGAPRVVSLAPSITEIVCALGAEKMLVGRTSACDYPPGIVKNIPVIGGFGAPSLEALLRVQPTIVLDVDLEDEAVRGAITGLEIRYLRVQCARLDDIPAAVKKIGIVVCAEQRANQLADLLGRQIAALRSAAEKSGEAKTAPAVFVEIWSDPLMTAGSGSLITELITLAGGRNIGAEVARDYFPVSPEWIIAHDPDIIICLDLADAKAVSARAGWSKLKAVRSGRVYAGLDNNIIERPGPRVLAGVAVLRECISGKKK